MKLVVADIEQGRRKLQINTEFAKRMAAKAGDRSGDGGDWTVLKRFVQLYQLFWL